MSESVQISPEGYEIIRRLKDEPAIKTTVAATMDTQNEMTAGYIRQYYMSGPGKSDPGTLAVVTGRLRRSVDRIKARIAGGLVVSGVGSNVIYAAAHEFGVDKEVSVREHSMRNSIADRFEFKGGGGLLVDRFSALRMGILSKGQMSQATRESGQYAIAKRGARRVVKGGDVAVKSHTRRMHLIARRIFSRGIENRLPDYGRAVSDAIVKQWGGAAS
jgi:hypothetical protein